ncbi:hypothetical protein OVA26_16595 [Microbacterium sp. SL62]|uniref:hypothetical protein n=1 Tax=Microbacterium sp. SL62 TaxID=2995139 RepID=UPI002273276B|nr:hypothetical protein [Microbacterium sp. SL62]MCY1718557.1 hypothetical protein [Microbacterium sp. SL62]
MSDSTTARDRAITRDAKTWSRVTNTKYTEALRLIEHPLHQGILGDRIVVRDLLRTLEDHPVIGSAHTRSTFGARGLGDDTPLVDELSPTMFRQILLCVEFLRMFTPSTEVDEASRHEVDSYTLKHRLEHFLERTTPEHITIGAMILAAAVLELPIREQKFELGKSRNVLITLPRHEAEFMRGEHPALNARRGGTYHRPPGYRRLFAVLDKASRGEAFVDELHADHDRKPTLSGFHVWLASQIDRDTDDVPFVRDYLAGIADSDHDPAASGEDLRGILNGLPRVHEDWLAAAEGYIAEYERAQPEH